MATVLLSLTFIRGRSVPQLERVEFSHPLLQTRLVSTRGQASGAHGSLGSFPWTAGALAVSYLIVSTKQSALTGTNEEFVLKGEGGSLAASLDYSISKSPRWVIEMFGTDSRGETLLKRLIIRSNPERKRPGPVVLKVNRLILPAKNISIYLGDELLENSQTLMKLADSLVAQSDSNSQLTPTQRTITRQRSGSIAQLLISNMPSNLAFREEWLPIVNPIVQDSRSSLRGTVYDYEVARWWRTLQGQVYLHTNVGLLKRGVSIQRIFLLTSAEKHFQEALQLAYLQELLGLNTRVAGAHCVEKLAISGSAMVSVHDDLFAAVHHLQASTGTTLIETKEGSVKQVAAWYDAIFEDPSICSKPSTILQTLPGHERLVSETKQLADQLMASWPLPLAAKLLDLRPRGAFKR